MMKYLSSRRCGLVFVSVIGLIFGGLSNADQKVSISFNVYHGYGATT